MSEEARDTGWMRAALGLARRGLGRVWPNPAVGCVLVANGVVVGRGRTADGGRPHAEAVALAQAGARARGSTIATTTRATPAAISAPVQGGVRPVWEQGSSVV